MKAIRKAASIEGHSLTASVYRQLPSLFSKQIARRLANEERGLAQKHNQQKKKKEEVVELVKMGINKPKKKRSRLSFLGIGTTVTPTNSKKKVVPVDDDDDFDDEEKKKKKKKSQRTSFIGQIKEKLLKRSSSTSSYGSKMSLKSISEDDEPPGVRSRRNSSRISYGEDEVEVLRRSIYGSENGKPLVSDDDRNVDVEDLLSFPIKKDTSTNPYERTHNNVHRAPTSANPYS